MTDYQTFDDEVEDWLALSWLAQRQGPDFDKFVNQVTTVGNQEIAAARRLNQTRVKTKASRRARRANR